MVMRTLTHNTHLAAFAFGSTLMMIPHFYMLNNQNASVLSLSTQKEFEKALGPPNNPSASPTKGPPTPQAVVEGLTTDASAPMLPSESLSPPVMYSSTNQISEPSIFNARASWLVGKPVHGNAYLTYTKIRHTGWLVPAVVFNSDFTLGVFWQWVHGLLPEVEYVNRAGSALVSRLPCVFRWVRKAACRRFMLAVRRRLYHCLVVLKT